MGTQGPLILILVRVISITGVAITVGALAAFVVAVIVGVSLRSTLVFIMFLLDLLFKFRLEVVKLANQRRK